MEEIFLNRPEIPLDDFLMVFTSAALVMLLGLAFVTLFTLAKSKKIKHFYVYISYLFWLAQTYYLYLLSDLIGSEPFTKKVLIGAMIGFLVMPHFVYFLVQKTHNNYEHNKISKKEVKHG